MTYALVGTVVSDCDTAADFTNNNAGANISTDDDFVEGTGAVGDKMSGSNELLVSDNLLGGAAGVYDFSVAGADEGAHFIGWLNTKTSINATSGLQVMFRNATGHEGSWFVMPAFFYKGGFITRVINPEADFDTSTTWTLTGNPAQLDDVSEMGFEYDMVATIMGNFNNSQADQFTVGFGVRADVGSSGTPNDFAGVIAADEGTAFWGWWSTANGANVGKGKLYIGPATGTVASWFVDSAFSVNFADENVAVGFYEFNIRGANTTCTWTLANISAANTTNARWSLTLDSATGDTTGGFDDINGTYSGSDVITLNVNATLTGTSLIDGNSLIQTSATMVGITVIAANTATGVAYITSDDIGLITDSEFNFSAGHAIELTATGTYNVDNLQFIGGYTGTGNSASIYNNSGGAVTLDVINGSSGVSVRNGAGASTTINNSVTVAVSGVTEGASVKVVANETVGTITTGDTLGEGLADSAGEFSFSIDYEGAFDPSGLDAIVRARQQGLPNWAIHQDNATFADQTTAANSAADDDMTLLIAAPVAGQDYYYFGMAEQFPRAKLDVSTVGTGTYTGAWEYWNGSIWTALSGVTDGTDNFKNTGANIIEFTLPGNWATTSVDAKGPSYFVRWAYVSGTVTIAPTGRKCQLDVTRYLPFVQSRIIESTGLTVVANWTVDSIAKFDPND